MVILPGIVSISTAPPAEGQYIDVDGYYGSGTRRAVLNIQNRYGLTADGVYSPNTGSAMRWRASNGSIGRWN
ncbi:peptidoglycan-binding protein [Actinomyces faecalis]|uniref:peptidoglycan-binding domain-containing protein n=1 Tax=Actinomyces faecalis TaxID=2722820 RepID=UPI00155489D9